MTLCRLVLKRLCGIRSIMHGRLREGSRMSGWGRQLIIIDKISRVNQQRKMVGYIGIDFGGRVGMCPLGWPIFTWGKFFV